MNIFTLVAAIPYQQGERYALGERIEIPLVAAFGGVLCLGLMVWYIRKVKKEKRRRRERSVDSN